MAKEQAETISSGYDESKIKVLEGLEAGGASGRACISAIPPCAACTTWCGKS